MMKKILLAGFSIIMLVTVNACKKNDNTPSNTASVMFVNGCAGTNNVDVTVNGTKVPAAANLPFLKSSGYQAITAGSGLTIAYSLSATATPLISDNETLTAGLHYSSFTGGLVTGTSTATAFAIDDLTPPPAGMAKVRFVNLCIDNLTTGCYVGLTKIDSNVAYKTCTPFFNVTGATTAKISMIDQANAAISAAISNQTLTAGKIYTFMLTGTSAVSSGTSSLTLTVINNN